MSENNGTESNSAMNTIEANENEEPKNRNLTQKDVSEEIKSFIALLTRQLDELTWLVQNLSVASYANHYPTRITMRVATCRDTRSTR